MAFGRYLFDKSSPETFAFFHIGLGMFCAMMKDSRLFQGTNYYAGEIGHTIVNPEGKKCEWRQARLSSDLLQRNLALKILPVTLQQQRCNGSDFPKAFRGRTDAGGYVQGLLPGRPSGRQLHFHCPEIFRCYQFPIWPLL